MSRSTVQRRTVVRVAAAWALLPLGILCAAPVRPSSPPRAAVNLDFEADSDPGGLPAGWIGGALGYEVGADRDVVQSGRASVRIEATEDALTDTAFAPLLQSIPADPWRGQRVRLSGWLRTRDVATGWAALWMRIDSAEVPSMAFDNMRDRGPRGTSPWTRYEVVLDVDLEASEIFFGVLLAGNGTAWADHLALEAVSESVATTASAPPDV